MCSLVCSWDPSLLIFVIVMSVLAKQIHKKFANKEHANRKTVVRLMISMMVVMALFGLTWVFGALTVCEASTAFQFLFAIFNSLHSFLCFFLCVWKRRSRVLVAGVLLWKEDKKCHSVNTAECKTGETHFPWKAIRNQSYHYWSDT